MGKASRKKKEDGDIYYIHQLHSATLYKIYAKDDEDAHTKATEKFGEDNYILGKKLQKGLIKEEQKQIYRDSEDAAGRLMGPWGKTAMQFLHKKY